MRGRATAARPGRGLAHAVIAVSGLVTATVVLQALLADGYVAGIRTAARTGEVTGTLAVVGALMVAQVVLLVAGLVVTGLWMRSLRRFAERVDPDCPHRRRRWWAFGGWVVPIVNLWFPVQYLGDVREALRPDRRRSLGWWWTAWLAYLLLDRYLANLGDTAEELLQVPGAMLLQGLVTTVAFVLWVRVVLYLQRSAEEVPGWVLERTALEPDPDAYRHDQAPPGAPIYGPASAGPGPVTVSPPTPQTPPSQQVQPPGPPGPAGAAG